MLNIFKNKIVLITGGTGSFGQNFVRYLLKNTAAKKIIVFSRDEFKQHQMDQAIDNTADRLRYFIGDVRDLPRLQRAFHKADIVVHAAALKHVPAMEYNPTEAIKTNIIGSQNVIEAAVDQQVQKVLLISSDKASSPANLYGATKLCGEKLFTAANIYAPKKTFFSSVRYGNVIASRGSVIEIWQKKIQTKTVNITHPEMTRFWITFSQSIDLVMFALENMSGGEIFVPKIPSMKLADVIKAVAPHARKKITGIRPGEKLHEALITEEEARHTVELDKYYIIIPEFNYFSLDVYDKYRRMGKKVEQPFTYTSHTNTVWLTKSEFKKELKANLI